MRIIVAGIGEVGTHLAAMLANSYHDIVAIDPNPELLEKLQREADLITLEGSASSLVTLKQAEVGKADLFIAVAHLEDTNITSAILAKRLGAKRVVARIDNNEYLQAENLALFREMGIDSLIYPEKLASQVVIGLLGEAGSLEYIDFANGKLVLSAFKLENEMPFVGQTLEQIDRALEEIAFRAVAISREGETIIPKGDARLVAGDIIYIISNQKGIEAWRRLIGTSAFRVDNLMVLGGSRIGIRTCLDLEGRVKNITLIESDRAKCEKIEPLFKKTLLINGDGRDTDLLLEEGLENVDSFVAVTGNSETNILACMAARRAGVKQIIAEVENLDYIALAESIGIDAVVNKKLITASRIFRYTMGGDISTIHCLTGSDAEVLEFIVRENAPVTRGRVKDLNMPRHTIIGGVIRGDRAFIAVGDTRIERGDRVVVFTAGTSNERLTKFFR